MTLEQHGFEPCICTYVWIFFTKYILQYYTIWGWLNLWMWYCGYGGPNVNLYANFQLCGGWALLSPVLFKGRLCFYPHYKVSIMRARAFVILFATLSITVLVHSKCIINICWVNKLVNKWMHQNLFSLYFVELYSILMESFSGSI